MNKLQSAAALVLVGICWWSCQRRPTPIKFEGQTMGTTYHITYFDSLERNFKPSVDSLLTVVNASINNYDKNAEVSLFNLSQGQRAAHSTHFLRPLRVAAQVWKASHGAFDPTVMPLVNLWGFGWKKNLPPPDSAQLDSLLTTVGFNKIHFDRDSVWKDDARTQLDFGGIGQGYGADVIYEFLRARGIRHMLVELGGEGLAGGKNLELNKGWKIGILDPASKPDSLAYIAYVSLTDMAFTTSGNYFNYKIINGKRVSHTISPQTGRPVQYALLSASVFADDCTTADAWGTAFMAMGHERAITMLQAHPELSALLLYTTNEQGGIAAYVSPAMAAHIQFVGKGL